MKDESKNFMIRWRWAAWRVQDGSMLGLTYYVILAVALFMEMDGTGAFPSQEQLARGMKMSLPTIKKHLKLAVQMGWLRRVRRRSRYGTVYHYEATLPGEGETVQPGNEISRKRSDRETLATPSGKRQLARPGSKVSPTSRGTSQGTPTRSGAGLSADADQRRANQDDDEDCGPFSVPPHFEPDGVADPDAGVGEPHEDHDD